VVDELEVLLPVDLGDEGEVVEAVVAECPGGLEEFFTRDLELGVAVAPLEAGAIDRLEDVLDEGWLRRLFGSLGRGCGGCRRGWRGRRGRGLCCSSR
jgi:hypothetical protein